MAVLLATQNLNAVLRILQWSVIALIFLFFLRVIRAVWVEMSPATVRKPRSERRRNAARSGPRPVRPSRPRQSRRRQLYLKVVEPPEHAGRTYDLDDELTVGRSPGCGVSMTDDIYTSTLHARLFRHNDQLWVEDLGSTNGTFVNSERITQACGSARVICSRSAPPCSRSPGDRPAVGLGHRRRPGPHRQPGPAPRAAQPLRRGRRHGRPRRRRGGGAGRGRDPRAAFDRDPTADGLRRRSPRPTAPSGSESQVNDGPARHGHHPHRRRPGRRRTGEDVLALANVGDSRAYVFSEGRWPRSPPTTAWPRSGCATAR